MDGLEVIRVDGYT